MNVGDFLQITRGLPQLRKLRDIMDHLYALFDRRCRTQTALQKLKKLRQWVKRFKWIGDTLKKVFTPTLEKALTFLDMISCYRPRPRRSNEVIAVTARCKRVSTEFAAKPA